MNLLTFFSWAKRALFVGAVLTTAGLISCSDDDEDTSFNGTVMDLISDAKFQQAQGAAADVALDSLVKYLAIYPDLVAALDGTNEVTLFAPSNQAFINLLTNTPGFPSNIKTINPAIVKGVLLYHVVSGTTLSSDLEPTGTGAGINSLFPVTDGCTGAPTGAYGVIKVNDNGTLLTGSTNAEIDVLLADQKANNGVVHVVESVMIPPTVGTSLTPILGKLSGTVSLGANFTHLNTLVRKADCANANAATRISTILSSTGPYTAFLPPNAVFEGAAAAQSITVEQFLASISAAQADAIIKNHIVSGSNASSALTNGQELTTLTGSKLTVTISGNNVLIKSTGIANPAPIAVKDLAHGNGVAHVIGGLLMP